jgi:DNA-directed RNA polymerase specialized sigma24 family protein
MKELRDYFGEDKLTCLLCGKLCVQLVAHIGPAHGLSADAYKEQFGIPWTYGLAGKSFRRRSSLRMKALRRSGRLPPSPSPGHIQKLAVTYKKRRPAAQAVRDDSRKKLLALHGKKEKWGPEDFEEFLRRIALGRTPSEVGRDEDMPGAKWFLRAVKKDVTLDRRFRRLWDSLPHAVHVRASKLGEKFKRDIVRLRRRDLTWGEIAAALGVSPSTARSTWHELKKRGALSARDLEHETKI